MNDTFRVSLAVGCNRKAIRDGDLLAGALEWFANVMRLMPASAIHVFAIGVEEIESRLRINRQMVAEACAPWFEAAQ